MEVTARSVPTGAQKEGAFPIYQEYQITGSYKVVSFLLQKKTHKQKLYNKLLMNFSSDGNQTRGLLRDVFEPWDSVHG